jgi:hypothetical protein
VLTYQVVGGERSLVLAAPALTISPGGAPYRLPRMFDVTQTAPQFELRRLVRIPGRRADQVGALSPETDGVSVRSAPLVDELIPTERVVVVAHSGATRAYPVRVLQGCLGVRDDLGDARVFVCWNDLTQLARCLVAGVDGRDVEWADAGLLYGANNVLYDAESGSLWDSSSGICLAGSMAGQAAEIVPAAVWPWNRWRDRQVGADVLMTPRLSGPPRAEELDPTRALRATDLYLQATRQPAEPSIGPLDARAFVLGVSIGGQARAYPLAELAQAGIEHVVDSVGGQAVDVTITSSRTARATSAGGPIDAPVMLWFAWQEVHPASDVYSPVPEQADVPSAVE